MTATPDDLAARLAAVGAPALVRAIEAHRPEIEARAGGPVRRWALDLAIPPIEAAAGALCLGLNRAVLAELARYTLADVLASLLAAAAAEGRTAHPTILQATP